MVAVLLGVTAALTLLLFITSVAVANRTTPLTVVDASLTLSVNAPPAFAVFMILPFASTSISETEAHTCHSFCDKDGCLLVLSVLA